MSKHKNNIPDGLRLDSTNEGMMTSRRKALAGFGRQLLTTSYPILYERGEVRFLRADYYFLYHLLSMFFLGGGLRG